MTSEYEVIESSLNPAPELTEEQKRHPYCVVQANFQEIMTAEATGEQVLAFATGLVEKEAPVRVVNSIYSFLTTAKPGDYLWTGHLTPLIICLRDEKEIGIKVEKNLNQMKPE